MQETINISKIQFQVEMTFDYSFNNLCFRGIRSSKFRHVYAAPVKKEKQFENIRITRNAHDSSYCSLNPKFIAVVLETGGGGSFLVIPVDRPGRVELSWSCRVTGHTAPVLDIAWSPFNDNIIASSSEDCSVRVWYVPDGQSMLELDQSLVTMTGHKRKVGQISWHPAANNILASSGHDNLIIVWNVSRGESVVSIKCHLDHVYSFSWNKRGSHIVTSCKDKQLRIIDARSGEVTSQGEGHQGGKPGKVVWCGDVVLSTGFTKSSGRQVAVWSPSDLSSPLTMQTLDTSSGVLTPFYDPDTNIVYIVGRGDGNIRLYELLHQAPWITFLTEIISGELYVRIISTGKSILS